MALDPGHLRVAMVSVHTSPLAQPGTGDAGGLNVYVTGLSAALARRGVAVEVFTRATSSTQPGLVRLDDGVLVRHIPAGPFEGLDKADLPGQLCAFTAGVLRTEARQDAGWYDIVHTHYWLSGQVGWLAADRWDAPLVHTAHTLARVKNAALAPGDAPEPLGRIIGEEQVVAEADALVASTAQEASDLIKDYAALPERVHVVPPGVDLEVFGEAAGLDRDYLRQQLGLPSGGLILFAGRVQPLKGPDVLVRALGELTRRGHPLPTLVVLGGPSGRATAVRELEALAHTEAVADHLIVRQPVPSAELARYFRAADVVAVPSHSESFGLVAAEAQATGATVVAASVGGLRSVIADGESGVLIEGHDPARWARTIGDLLADLERRRALGEGGRRAASRFGWDESATQILKVYAAAKQVREERGR